MPASADECATIFAAVITQAKAPYAASATISHPGQPDKKVEQVNIGDKMYVEVTGAWQSMPYSAQEVIDRATEKRKTSKQTCAKVGAETVSGEAATIYTDHEETPKGTVDSRLWLSDARGLPLKVEMHFQSGMVMNQLLRYDNVQAPAGAK